MKTKADRCEFSGCKHEARWLATKLWGGTIRTCDKHKPGGDRNRPNAFNCPDALRNLPAFYRVEAIAQ